MIWKQCGRCKKRIPAGSTCECIKAIKKERDRWYDKEKRDKKLAAFYCSKLWIRLQQECKERYCGLDVYELYHNRRIITGRISHHIIPIREDWEKRYDADNLIYLTDETHQFVHRQMDAGNREIIDELKRYQKMWKAEGEGESEKFRGTPAIRGV